MGTDAGALSDALGESKEVMEYCNRGLGEHRDVLPPLLQRLGEVDCFLHDSDHSYEHMAWEFSQAYPYVRAGGLLMSDDITSNRAWDEFTAGSDGPSTRINRLGVFRVPPSANADGNQPGRSQ